MMSFILSAVLLTIIALLFVLPALLKKNEPFNDEFDDLNTAIARDRLKEIKQQRDAGEISDEVYQQLHDELESTLALDLANSTRSPSAPAEIDATARNRRPAILLAISIPLIAALLYAELGDFNAATGEAIKSVRIPQGEGRPQMTIEEAAAKLEQRLQSEPDNVDGWFMLAKTYMVLKQFDKATQAFEKTLALVGDNADVLLPYVDALAMTEGGNLTGRAKPVLDKVIRMKPNDPMALWLAGTAESQQGDYKAALTYWYKLRPLLAGSMNDLTQLNELIQNAESHFSAEQLATLKQSLAVKEVAPVRIPVSKQPADQNSAVEIWVSVDMDPKLKDRVSATDTLFIFAKAVQGPPMPLAAVKKTVADLPMRISLTDAMAMMPQMRLSAFKQVKIAAVISRSGRPGVQPGDLFAEVSPVDVNTRDEVFLIINRVK